MNAFAPGIGTTAPLGAMRHAAKFRPPMSSLNLPTAVDGRGAAPHVKPTQGKEEGITDSMLECSRQTPEVLLVLPSSQ
eukprot:5246112-Prymnesium_polylepis.1